MAPRARPGAAPPDADRPGPFREDMAAILDGEPQADSAPRLPPPRPAGRRYIPVSNPRNVSYNSARSKKFGSSASVFDFHEDAEWSGDAVQIFSTKRGQLEGGTGAGGETAAPSNNTKIPLPARVRRSSPHTSEGPSPAAC